jgi:hypothetical protein
MDDTARMDHPPTNQAAIAVEPVKIPVSAIPQSLTVKGKAQEAWKWNDNLGENYLITSYIAPYDDKKKNQYGEEGQTAELSAVHYAKKGDQYVQVWVMNDAEKACPFDITCEFIPGSTTVTDLDKNGIAEIKVQYTIACRSDVSPATMKLLMHENGVPYTLRGNRWLPYSPEFKFTVTEKNVNLDDYPPLKDEGEEMLRSFGRYENEKDFAAAAPVFLTFARNEWLKFVMEKMGD